MFTHEGWEYDGPYFKFPLRNVLPKPVQKPHPPLWVACSQLETIELAGRCGIGALGFQFLSAEMAHAWVNVTYLSDEDYKAWAAMHGDVLRDREASGDAGSEGQTSQVEKCRGCN